MRSSRLGEHDCGLILADWIERVTGVDPAAAVRGTYQDEASLAALAGPLGLPRLFDRILLAGGLVRIEQPALGDCAMILPADDRPRGAICTGASPRAFVTVAEHGLWGIRSEVRLIAAWTFP